MTPDKLEFLALSGLPLVKPGDDLCELIVDACAAANEDLQTGDVLVVAQKIVSKAEDRYADLRHVEPSERATDLARETDKDPRLVELILSEAAEVLRHRPGVLIVVHRLGFVLANAGIDTSNVEPEGEAERVLLLPEDPDASAIGLRTALRERTGTDVAVIVNDSTGRAWRNGTSGMALGASGLPVLQDLRGERDLYGRPLQATQVGLGDELAAAASLLQGEAAEGRPVVRVRGLGAGTDGGAASALIRAKDEDLFR